MTLTAISVNVLKILEEAFCVSEPGDASSKPANLLHHVSTWNRTERCLFFALLICMGEGVFKRDCEKEKNKIISRFNP